MAGQSRSDDSVATRIKDAVKQRRVEMRLTQEQLAELGGVSPGTIKALEQGTRQRMYPGNEKDIGRALQWEADWLERLRDGLEPEQLAAGRLVTTQVNPQLEIIALMLDGVDQDTEREALREAALAVARVIDKKHTTA